MNFRRGVLTIAVLLGAIMTGRAGRFLAAEVPLEKPDLILVLGGDFYGPRMLAAAGLGTQGVAPLVLISGPPYHQQYESDLALEFLIQRGYRPELFLGFRHRARNTIEEASLLRPELCRLRARRVLLVTSNYHSRRALLLFQRMMPDVTFGIAPAGDPRFDPGRWWASAAQAQVLLREYASLLWNLTVGSLRFRPAGC